MSKKSEGDTYLNRRDDDDARRGAFFLALDDLLDDFPSSSSLSSSNQSFIVWRAVCPCYDVPTCQRVIGRAVAERFSRDATTRDANGRGTDNRRRVLTLSLPSAASGCVEAAGSSTRA